VIFGFLAVVALFVTMGRNTHKANDDNERSGQAHHPGSGSGALAATPGGGSSHSQYGSPDEPPQPPSGPESHGDGEGDGYEEDRVNPHAAGDGPSKTASEDADDADSADEEDDGKGDDGDEGSGPSSEGDAPSGGAGDEGTSEAEKEKARLEEELRKAEEQEVKADEAKAQSALGKLGSGLRSGLAKLFGDKASDKEIEDIAQAVESEVTAEVNQEIEVASAEILTKEVGKVGGQVEAWRGEGQDDAEVARDIQEEKASAVAELRRSVDEVEDRVEKSIRTRTSMAEKKILEERLSKKLGKKVKLTYVEQDERFDGMEEAMQQLPSLRGSKATRKKKDKKKKKKKKQSSDSSDSESASAASDSGSESREEQSAGEAEDGDTDY
jgi:hypothetical protein